MFEFPFSPLRHHNPSLLCQAGSCSPRQTILAAVAELRCQNVYVVKLSTLIESEPYGRKNQPGFVNAVAEIYTHKTPDALLNCLQAIEKKAGRKRGVRWGPRTLDIDILAYHGLIRMPSRTSIKPLALPHPGIAMRSFVLGPLHEIMPKWKHPATHKTATEMLKALRLN